MMEENLKNRLDQSSFEKQEFIRRKNDFRVTPEHMV
jgi:hypothetical protein